MKIAVLFTGRITGWKECLETLKTRFIDLYDDVDIFLSLDMKEANDDINEFKKHFNVVSEYYETYNKCLKEPPPFRSEETKERNTLSMFYHNMMAMNKVLDKMKSGKVYDVIVKFRGDISSTKSFIIPYHIIPNTLYIPNGYNFRGINDQIAFGSVLAMTIYCGIYHHIPKYVYKEQAIFNPEFLLMFHINLHNLNIMRFPYNYNLHPSRFGNNEYQPIITRVPIEELELADKETSIDEIQDNNKVDHNENNEQNEINDI